MLPKLKRLRKLKGMASLPLLDGRRKRVDTGHPPYSKAKSHFDVTDDRIAQLAHTLHDEGLARTIAALEERFPFGTLPEMIVYEFLQRSGKQFKYQVALFGGYRQGGIVPDFTVSNNGTALAILVNGGYWHNRPGMKENDASDKQRMIGSYVDGEVITRVVIVWEGKIVGNTDRERVLANALAGVEEPE